MMEYTVVANYSVVDFEDGVNDLIAHGWVPLGGVSISSYERDDGLVGKVFAQAMTRDTDAGDGG